MRASAAVVHHGTHRTHGTYDFCPLGRYGTLGEREILMPDESSKYGMISALSELNYGSDEVESGLELASLGSDYPTWSVYGCADSS